MSNYKDYGIDIPNGKYAGEVAVICPKCSADRKKQNLKPLSVNLDKGAWKCNHCGWVGGLPKENYTPPIPKIYVKPLWKNKTNLSDRLIKYFESRKISQSTLLKMKVTEDSVWLPQIERETNCVVFNYFRNDELINYKARDGAKNFALAKGAELIFYNLDSLIGATEAYIIEGEVDVLSFVEAGIQREGTAVLGVPNGANLKTNNLSYIDNCIHLFENITKIHLATDDDIAGRKLRGDLVNRFGKEICDYIEFKGKKDPNELLVSEGITGLIEACSDKKHFPIVGVFNVSDYSTDIDDMYHKGIDRGVGIGMPEFDAHLRFVRGWITVITGQPSSGKSDWTDQMALRLMKNHGWKFAFYSPENDPFPLHFSKLARKLIGKSWFGKNKINEAEKDLCKKFLEDKFWVIKPKEDFSLDSILESVEGLIRQKGIDCFVIDAWNRLDHKYSGANEAKYVQESLMKLDSFCRNRNVHCFLIAHPTKLEPDKRTGDYPVVRMYNISGGAHFRNISANGISVHRDFKNELTEIYIQKVKFIPYWGKMGFVKMKYEVESGRYNEYVIDPNHKNTEDKSNWITNTAVQQKIEIPEVAGNSDIITNQHIADESMPF